MHRPGAAHAQHPAVPRPARLHRQPRRGRGHLRRPLAARRCCGRCVDKLRDGPARRRDGRRRRDVAVPDGSAHHDYEELLAAAEPRRTFARRRREHGPRRCATRAAPPATRRASSTRHRSTVLHSHGRADSPTASASAERDVVLPVVPDVPRQRLGAAPTAPCSPGATLVMPGPEPVAAGDRRAASSGSGSRSPPACRRSGWACCPMLDGPRPVGAARDPVRRLGGAAGRCRRPTATQIGLPDPAGVGHDRDQPGRHRSAGSAVDAGPIAPRTSWPTSAPGQGHRRAAASTLRIVDPDTGEAAAVGRRGHRRAAGRGPVDRAGVLQRRARRRAVFTDDGWLRTGDVATVDARRLHPARRPHQGPHQVRRRVDLLGRARERDHGATRRSPRPR